MLGVEGEGVSPASFAVLPTLALVHAWVSLAEAIAAGGGRTLAFDALTIREGSAAWLLSSPEPELAMSSFQTAHLYVVGGTEVPRGLRTKVLDTRAALEQLPSSHAPYLELGARRSPLPKQFLVASPYREVTTVRGEIVDAGGIRPHVRLASSARMLFLTASRELAKRAGQALYRRVEATVALAWDGDQLVEGTLLDFEELETLSPDEEIARWRQWFSEAGRDWDAVDAIELELDRQRSDDRDH